MYIFIGRIGPVSFKWLNYYFCTFIFECCYFAWRERHLFHLIWMIKLTLRMDSPLNAAKLSQNMNWNERIYFSTWSYLCNFLFHFLNGSLTFKSIYCFLCSTRLWCCNSELLRNQFWQYSHSTSSWKSVWWSFSWVRFSKFAVHWVWVQ